jgi:hypothetical protein
MKRPFVIYVFLLVSCMTMAQENAYKSVSDYGKYINRDGEYLELPDDVYPEKEFQDGYVSIRHPSNGNNFSIINYKGEIVGNPWDGIDRVKDGRLFATKWNGLYGYVNRAGDEIIQPQFDEAGWFYGEYARVIQDGIQKVINKNGEIIFSEETLKQYNGQDIHITTPSDGVILVSLMFELPRLVYQFVDLRGNSITDQIEGDILGFNSGIGFYTGGIQGKWVAINNTGNVLETFPPAELYYPAQEQLFIQLKDGEMRYLDKRGQVRIENNYSFITPFYEGFAAVSKNEPQLNQNLMAFQYSRIRREGRGSYQIIDRTGTPINDVYYLGVPKFFQGGVAQVQLLSSDGQSRHTALIDLKDGGRIFDITEERVIRGRPIIDETTTRYSPE